MLKDNRLTRTCYVPPGMEKEFQQLELELRRQFEPESFLEEMLFSQVLRAAWTMHRVETRLRELEDAGRDPVAMPEEKLIRHYADLRAHQIQAMKSLQRSLREVRSQRAAVARQKKMLAEGEPSRQQRPRARPDTSKGKKEYVN